MRIRGDTMNNKTDELINELTQDIIELYDIKIPINNINEVVQKLGGAIEETTNNLIVELKSGMMYLSYLYHYL